MQRDIDTVEELLLKWADSMRKPDQGVQGYPNKASGGFTHSWIKDSDELVENANAEELVKIQAAIDSLKQPHYEVICKRHRIGRPLVWRWGNEVELYGHAKQAFKIIYFSRN